MKICPENQWQKEQLKKALRKQNFFIGRVSTFNAL